MVSVEVTGAEVGHEHLVTRCAAAGHESFGTAAFAIDAFTFWGAGVNPFVGMLGIVSFQP